MNLGILDILIFVGYFVGVIAFAITVAARSKTKSSSDYFLASNKLPWYAVGASFVASNISTEHFIGMVGWGFLYGMAVANWEWANAATFSVLIWIFLPFYMRGNISTMPEFLEKRFNKACRYIYAIVMIIGLVIAMLGGVLFAGAKAINVFFPQIEIWLGILILAAAAGTYTIYGGLLSAVWADLLQYCLLMVGGIVVSVFGLYYAGGFSELVSAMPEKFIIFYSSKHEMIPWTGFVSGLVSVGLWYSCANQFMVQRCLGAKSEWDARMGVVMAGFSKAILPFIVVVPGIIAFYLFQSRISDGDQAWPFLVRQFLPAGLTGLVLAGLSSAIMSTLSAITNSAATIFTLDLYKTILRPTASDKELHLTGRISGVAVMLVGVTVAIILAFFPGITVFQLIQTVFFYIAPPVAACFLVGILWKRATPTAAMLTLILGFSVLLPATIFILFRRIAFLQPYDNFMHHTFVVFLMSVVLLVVLSLFTRPKSAEQLKGVIWTSSALRVLEDEKGRHRGFKSLGLWWFLMVATIGGLYAYTASRSSNTEWLEAEHMPYEISSNAHARIQRRSELAGKQTFNLWTGAGQILFTPTASGQMITFELPVTKKGIYRIDALVTIGNDYGRFRVKINGQESLITYPISEFSTHGKRFSVVTKQTSVFDGKEVFQNHNEIASGDTIAGPHVVQRIGLGEFELYQGIVYVAFIADDVKDANAFLGVDQLMLTCQGK